MALLLNEYPYSDYQKINLDWLLDLGNKLKADAESGAFNGADGEQGERGYGVYGGNVTITSYSVPVGGSVVTYPYTVLKTAVQNAAVNDFIVGSYNGLVIIFKVNVDIGDRLAGFTALTLTGSQGEPGEGGLTEAMKQALLQLARKVAYIDGNGQTYYNALYTAFYGGTPVVVLDSITAVFNQGSTVVYDTDTLDSLKSMLTVTAHYSDNSTATVPSADYTLSGTLTAGTSVVTVSYSGETTTFNVTVTHGVVDTTAQIAKEGYVFSGTGDGEYPVTNGGETIIYELDSPTTVLHPAGVIVQDGLFSTSRGQIQVYNGNTYVNYVDETGRWAKAPAATYTEYNSKSWTISMYDGIAFSVDLRYLDDSYMYDYTTGQVWFAGINTPYYGMSNISEAQGG